MNVLYEEDGGFKVATIMSEQGGSLQVEAPHGKRSKIKSSHVLLQFQSPSAGELMAQAQAMADTFELEFLWECAPQEEFAFAALGADYFGHAPTPVESAALLLALHSSPVYFHRKGRGHYKPAPPEILKAALAAVEKKRLQAMEQAQWADALLAGQAPASVARMAPSLLVKPDKNTQEYKALALACEKAGLSAREVLLRSGAFNGPYDLHRRSFEVVQFPRGVGFPPVSVPAIPDLPKAPAPAFSIDDITTTEIDDAFSVQWGPGDQATIGIHIAAPGLLIQKGDAIDHIARDRLSTVYMPGDKITMLPDALVQAATLEAGRTVPTLSLYFTVNVNTGAIDGTPYTRLESIEVASNLRHNLLDEKVTEAALALWATQLPGVDPVQTAADGAVDASVVGVNEVPHALELALLWRVSRILSDIRTQVRGKPEQNHRIDYNFYVNDGVVSIVPRRRDAPLDLLVAEFMILANQTWGGLMRDHEIPGIYRIQPPMGRVRMATHAAPHAGLGVPQYAWSTSPLRRYVDLVNQWQVLAITQGTPVPFPPKDADLYATVSAFDTTYKAYADFQSSMERYWCLKWLEQHDVKQAMAAVLRDDLVRLQDIPLVIRLPGFGGHARGTLLTLEIMSIDEVSIDLDCRVIEVLTAQGQDILDEELSEDDAAAEDVADTSIETPEVGPGLQAEA